MLELLKVKTIKYILSDTRLTFLLPADRTDALKVQIGISQGKIKNVEDAEIAAQQKTDEALRARAEKDIDYWRTEKTHLRIKEELLRAEKLQLRDQLLIEKQLQPGKLSFICAHYV